MTPRPRKYFPVIEKSEGGRIEFKRRYTSAAAAMQAALSFGWNEDEITIKIETPIPGRAETVNRPKATCPNCGHPIPAE